jgi:hypothetical protein
MAESKLSVADETAWEKLIRRRAYDIYEQRGREEGHELDDWLLAEADFRKRQLGKSSTAPKKKAHRAVAV